MIATSYAEARRDAGNHDGGRQSTAAPLNLATAGGLLLMLVVALLTVAGVWQVGAWL